MTMVFADLAEFAVDWDWQRSLTVWALAGPQPESRFDRKVLEYGLPGKPADERQARAAARRWWRAHGRGEALGQPTHA